MIQCNWSQQRKRRLLRSSKHDLNNYNNRLHWMIMIPFAITLYGQCCRRHVVGQQVVSDVSIVRSCLTLEVCVTCVLNQITLIYYYACSLLEVLEPTERMIA